MTYRHVAGFFAYYLLVCAIILTIKGEFIENAQAAWRLVDLCLYSVLRRSPGADFPALSFCDSPGWPQQISFTEAATVGEKIKELVSGTNGVLLAAVRFLSSLAFQLWAKTDAFVNKLLSTYGLCKYYRARDKSGLAANLFFPRRYLVLPLPRPLAPHNFFPSIYRAPPSCHEDG